MTVDQLRALRLGPDARLQVRYGRDSDGTLVAIVGLLQQTALDFASIDVMRTEPRDSDASPFVRIPTSAISDIWVLQPVTPTPDPDGENVPVSLVRLFP